MGRIKRDRQGRKAEVKRGSRYSVLANSQNLGTKLLVETVAYRYIPFIIYLLIPGRYGLL